MLRGIRQLASLLGCEEEATTLQHNGVLRYMSQQVAPLQPLADKTNQQAAVPLLG